MQAATTVFLALLLAHVVGDFMLQGHRVVEGKSKGSWTAFLEHGGLHYLASLALVGIFVPASFASMRFQVSVLLLAVIHVGIDAGKARAVKSGPAKDGRLAFLVDQSLHVLTVALFSLVITGQVMDGMSAPLGWLRSHANRILAIGVLYLGTIFGGGHLVRHLLGPLEEKLNTGSDKATEELEKAGMYIGWLERFLVLTAIMTGSIATVGLIVAAKSLFRFPELRDRPFAEYFLIGTLLSVSFAAVSGLALRAILEAN